MSKPFWKDWDGTVTDRTYALIVVGFFSLVGVVLALSWIFHKAAEFVVKLVIPTT